MPAIRSRSLSALCLLPLACGDALGPGERRYNLTFDDGWGIYETHVDSLRIRSVMQDTLTAYDLSWSPDGREVAFTRQYFEEGQYHYRVVVYDAVDATQRVLTQGPDDSFQPAWSPDGTRIAYLARPVDEFDAALRVVRPDGTGDAPLGTERYYLRPPRWSPDGQYLAATRSDLTVVTVRAMTGSVVRAIGPGMSPTWSPDGQRLTFVADGLTIVTANGTDARHLPLVAYDPAWSPDGDWIAFDTGGGVYLLSPDAFVTANNTLDSSMIRFVGPYNRPAWRLRQ
jgi:Tol biopolymer transport system component